MTVISHAYFRLRSKNKYFFNFHLLMPAALEVLIHEVPFVSLCHHNNFILSQNRVLHAIDAKTQPRLNTVKDLKDTANAVLMEGVMSSVMAIE